MDQKTMVHLHNGIILSREKEGAPTLRDVMDGTGKHYAKWNKPSDERQIPYDLSYKWNVINKTSKQNITRKKIVLNHTYNEGVIFKIYKEIICLIVKI